MHRKSVARQCFCGSLLLHFTVLRFPVGVRRERTRFTAASEPMGFSGVRSRRTPTANPYGEPLRETNFIR